MPKRRQVSEKASTSNSQMHWVEIMTSQSKQGAMHQSKYGNQQSQGLQQKTPGGAKKNHGVAARANQLSEQTHRAIDQLIN